MAAPQDVTLEGPTVLQSQFPGGLEGCPEKRLTCRDNRDVLTAKVLMQGVVWKICQRNNHLSS